MYSYVPYTIPVSETDLMGIVHHSYYARYFERGRVEFLRDIGIVYRELATIGIHFPVLNLECKYRKPLHFDDLIWIESKISFLNKTRLCFDYRIAIAENSPKNRDEVKCKFLKNPLDLKLDLSTLGRSEHCALAPDGKPQRIPDNLLKLLTKYYVEDAGNNKNFGRKK